MENNALTLQKENNKKSWEEIRNNEEENIRQYECRDALESCKLYAQQLRCKYGVPGFSVCISHEGDAVIDEGFGVQDLENPSPTPKDLRGNIASISKSFTGHIACKVEESQPLLKKEVWKIDIWEFLKKYREALEIRAPLFYNVDKLKDDGKLVDKWTDNKCWPFIWLLANKSGWDHYIRKGAYYETENVIMLNFMYKLTTREKLMRMLIYRQLKVNPGNYFYSNTGFNLASLILEDIQKETFTDFSQKELFRLGLYNTTYDKNHFEVPFKFYKSSTHCNFSELYTKLKSDNFGIIEKNLRHLYKIKLEPGRDLNKTYGHSRGFMSKQNFEHELFNCFRNDFSWKYPSEGMVATAKDLDRFLNLYANMYKNCGGKNFENFGPISANNFKKVVTKYTEDHRLSKYPGSKIPDSMSGTSFNKHAQKNFERQGYGIGWRIRDQMLRFVPDPLRVRMFGHDGLTQGFMSNAAFYVTTQYMKDAASDIGGEKGTFYGSNQPPARNENEDDREDGCSCDVITVSFIWCQEETINGQVVNNEVSLDFWRMIDASHRNYIEFNA